MNEVFFSFKFQSRRRTLCYFILILRGGMVSSSRSYKFLLPLECFHFKILLKEFLDVKESFQIDYE